MFPIRRVLSPRSTPTEERAAAIQRDLRGGDFQQHLPLDRQPWRASGHLRMEVFQRKWPGPYLFLSLSSEVRLLHLGFATLGPLGSLEPSLCKGVEQEADGDCGSLGGVRDREMPCRKQRVHLFCGSRCRVCRTFSIRMRTSTTCIIIGREEVIINQSWSTPTIKNINRM